MMWTNYLSFQKIALGFLGLLSGTVRSEENKRHSAFVNGGGVSMQSIDGNKMHTVWSPHRGLCNVQVKFPKNVRCRIYLNIQQAKEVLKCSQG